MVKLLLGIGLTLLFAFSGYGVAKAIDIHVPTWVSAAITAAAIFIFGFGEGVD
jgi:hypothetical protein